MAADIGMGGSIGPKVTTGNAFDGNGLPAVNFADPTNAQDAATKNYVDTHTGAVPTGTGFRHVTSGAEDGTARAVNLASGDVTGTLPTGNQAAQSLAGSLGGTTATATVKQVDGSGSSDDFGGSAATVPIAAQEISWKVDANNGCLEYVGKCATTTNTDWTGFAFTPAADSVYDVVVTVLGWDTSGTSGAPTGDCYRYDLKFLVSRVASGTPAFTPSAGAILPLNTSGSNAVNGGTPQARVQLSTNLVQVQTLGPVAGKGWHWTFTFDVQRTYKT